MDVLYRRGQATAADVHSELDDAPTYTTVRGLLRILEDKGHVRHEQDGTRYVYIPTIERERAKKSAIRHMVNTFFEGSATQAIAALLDEDSKRLSDEDWDRLKAMIDRARKEGA